MRTNTYAHGGAQYRDEMDDDDDGNGFRSFSEWCSRKMYHTQTHKHTHTLFGPSGRTFFATDGAGTDEGEARALPFYAESTSFHWLYVFFQFFNAGFTRRTPYLYYALVVCAQVLGGSTGKTHIQLHTHTHPQRATATNMRVMMFVCWLWCRSSGRLY